MWCPQICLLFLIKINWGFPFSWLEIKCDFKVFRALWHQKVFLGLDYKLLTYESSDQLVVTFIFLGTFMMVALLYNNKTAYTKRTVQFRKTCLKIQFYVGGVEIIPRFFFWTFSCQRKWLYYRTLPNFSLMREVARRGWEFETYIAHNIQHVQGNTNDVKKMV